MRGVPGWTRTTDLQIRNLLLYPAELPGRLTRIAIDCEDMKLIEFGTKFLRQYLNFPAANQASGDSMD